MKRSEVIFGNQIPQKAIKKAQKEKLKYIKKYGDDSDISYPLTVHENAVLYPFMGVKNVALSSLIVDDKGEAFNLEKGIIIGNIRMGFGHYRISMAIASAAHAMGYVPYWFDLHSYQETTGGKIIAHLNKLYSMGSRWSQKYPLFNKLYWEPLNAEGFRKLTYNAVDQEVSQLMTSVFKEIPKEMPLIATHVWPAQAAVHSGMSRVVNVIPDNWPMALHLAEGSIHTVQTPSSYLGYRTLKGMDGLKCLNPMPEESLFDVGHYIDHELVVNLIADCEQRKQRVLKKETKRILMTVGGAGAQQDIFLALIKEQKEAIIRGEISLLINTGDHRGVYETLKQALQQTFIDHQHLLITYENKWDETVALSNRILTEQLTGIHLIYHEDIFAAVYGTNLLMRGADLLVTKPSELAFYPIPKLLIKRVGGHEAYGALRAAEVGDGTIECETIERAKQMLSLWHHDTYMALSLNENILKAHQIGIYNGAYRVIELAKGVLVSK
jgi:hypothetical protein